MTELQASRHPTAKEMDAYERVLTDAMAGDPTLFAREDYVEEAWRIVDPVLKSDTPIHEYEPETWGPAEMNRVHPRVAGMTLSSPLETADLLMRIGIATDHGGFELKQKLAERLRAAGHEIVDFGAHQLTPEDDYPDFVTPLGRAVAEGEVDRGVAVCGSGVGASVCANKVKGVRACLIEDNFSARQGVEDDNLNLLCLADAFKARNWRGI